MHHPLAPRGRGLGCGVKSGARLVIFYLNLLLQAETVVSVTGH